MKFLVVSGLSGSGKSTVLNALEDVGYYCVDNLPVELLPALAHEMLSNHRRSISGTVVGIDARNPPSDLERIPETLERLAANGVDCEVMFLDAEDATLLRRFSETRRKHPLSGPDVPLAEAIAQERELLAPVAASAQLRFDTSQTNPYQLRDLVVDRLVRERDRGLVLLFQSFGFKHGIPADADFVFDLRCLPNPHWQAALRPFTGKDSRVAEYLRGMPMVERMLDDLVRFLEAWIPSFEADKRGYLTVALGCTGGRHRSVYMTERLLAHFRARHRNVTARHRELD
jgi:UPF0042 nucleotide-binding protein